MDRVGNRSSKDTGGVNRVGNSMNNRSSMVNNWSSMNNRSSMVNNWGSMNNRGVMNNWSSMVNNRGSMVNNWGSMDNRGMMNNWCSMDNRCMVNNWCSMDNRSSMDSWCSSIASYSLIGHVNYITRVTISSIVDHLGSAIRESHPIVTRSRVAISLLFLGKVGTAVVITDTILISIKSRLREIR